MILTTNLRRALVVALAVLAIDRASKIRVVERLDLANRLRIEVADPWLNLTMAWNQGVNFGLFDLGQDGRHLAGRPCGRDRRALLVWVRRSRGWPAAIGAGAVIGGALGNVWDRLQWGAVADFLNMSCCGIRQPVRLQRRGRGDLWRRRRADPVRGRCAHGRARRRKRA